MPATQTDRPPALAPAPLSLPARQALRYRYTAGLAVADASALFISFGLAGMLRPTLPISNGLTLGMLIAPVTLALAFSNGAYSHPALVDWRYGLGRVMLAAAQAFGIVLLVAFSLQTSEAFSRVVFGTGLVLTLASLALVRWAMHLRVKGWTRGLLNELVIVDRCTIDLPRDGDVIDAQALSLTPDAGDPVMLNRLGQLVRGADYVLVCCPPERRADWAHLLKGTDVAGHILVPELDTLGGSRLGRFHDHPTVQVSTGALSIRERVQKRAFDLALAVPLIIVLTPVFLIVALLIKLDSKGPIFFTQQRLGRGNRLFQMIKFRSMHTSQASANGDRSTERSDPRVTRIGRILRMTSIDEMPQLFNVLHGDMSLVGPRPHALGSLAGLDLFWNVDRRYWHRHALKPGMTGLAQVRGHRGATSRPEDLIARLQSDLEYSEKWSVWRDLVILFSTVKVLVHKNAY